MATYRTLNGIGKRMGVTGETILRWIENEGFLAFKKGRFGKPALKQWVTNDDLIMRWEVSKCVKSRHDHFIRLEMLRERRLARALAAQGSQPLREDKAA